MLTWGALNCMMRAMLRSGRKAGAYRSLQMAISGRFSGWHPALLRRLPPAPAATAAGLSAVSSSESAAPSAA